jgi:hypothetical protein
MHDLGPLPYNYCFSFKLSNRKQRVVMSTCHVDLDRDFVAESVVAYAPAGILFRFFLNDGTSLNKFPVELLPMFDVSGKQRGCPFVPHVVYFPGDKITIEAQLAPDVNIGRKRLHVTLVMRGYMGVTQRLQSANAKSRNQARQPRRAPKT